MVRVLGYGVVKRTFNYENYEILTASYVVLYRFVAT